jgi:hypothetical protein
MIEEPAGPGHPLDFYPDLTAALAGPRARGTTGRETATGRRLRLIPDAAARRSAGKLARRLSAVPPASQDSAARPIPDPRLGRRYAPPAGSPFLHTDRRAVR